MHTLAGSLHPFAPMPRGSCIACLLSLLAVAPVEAQDLNYQTYLIGTRAMGMGGAFTGVADDPSAAFHNPAGLGPILRSSTSANLSVVAIEGWTIQGGYGSLLGPVDLSHDALPSLPLFVGFVQKFGDEGPDGVRQHGIALSIVRPALTRRSFRVDVADPELGLSNTLRIDHEDSAQWYGVSYGIRLGEGLAVGIGAWLALRQLRHREDEFVAERVVPIEDRRVADGFLARYSEANVDAFQLVFRLGLLWQIDPQWRLGLMLQPSPLDLSTNASISSRFGLATDAALEDLRFVERRNLRGSWPMPWQLRVGISHVLTEDFALSVDVAAYAPMGTGSPIRTFGPAELDPVSGEPVSPGRFIPSTWSANFTANVSVGFDALIADIVPLQGGLFTDLSAAPSIDGPTAEYRPPQVHGFGASIAGGLRRGDFDVQLGVAGVVGFGTGTGTTPLPDITPGGSYVPRDVQRYTVYLFLSGTERAAASLVREILTEIGITEDAPGARPAPAGRAEQAPSASEEEEEEEEEEESEETEPAPEDERQAAAPRAVRPTVAQGSGAFSRPMRFTASSTRASPTSASRRRTMDVGPALRARRRARGDRATRGRRRSSRAPRWPARRRSRARRACSRSRCRPRGSRRRAGAPRRRSRCR